MVWGRSDTLRLVGRGRRALALCAYAVAGLLLGLILQAAPAQAACTLSGSTYTCSGTDTTGVNAGSNVTINVLSGATVDVSGTPGTNAIQFVDTSTVTNAGTIITSSSDEGIKGHNTNSVTNSGTITAGFTGIDVNNGNTLVLNSGTINIISAGFGISVCCDNAAVTNSGTISALVTGSVGIFAGDRDTITNSGTITLGTTAIGIFAGNGPGGGVRSTITNSGTITALGGSNGIETNTFYSVVNSGTITVGVSGGGPIASGVLFDSSNNVLTNTGTITAMSGYGVQFNSTNTINNYGTIRSIGLGTSALCSCGGTGSTVNNFGTINGMITMPFSNALNNSGLITITDSTNSIGAGHSIGGAFTQSSGGILELRGDNSGTSDTITVGSATVAGTLRIATQALLYGATTSYLGVFNSTATVTTPFTSYTASSPFFTVTPDYNGGTSTSYTQINLTLNRTSFGSVPGETPNQRATGTALEAGYNGGVGLSANATTLFQNLFAATSLSALDQLSGVGTAATQSGALGLGGGFLGTIAQGPGFGPQTGTGGGPLGYASAEKRVHPAFAALALEQQAARRWQIWGMGFGATRKVAGSGDTGAPDITQSGGGGVIGASYLLDPDRLLGFAVGVSGSHFNVSSTSTSGDLTAGHFGVYGVQRWGSAYVNAALAYGRIGNSTSRTISGIGPTEIATGSFASDLFSSRIEVGWTRTIDRYKVTPFAALQFSQLWQRGYSETSTTLGGAPGILGLTFAPQSTSSLPVSLGTQVDTSFALASGTMISPFARAAWVHEFKPNTSVSPSFITIPGSAFTVAGISAPRDALKLDTGVRLPINAATAFVATANAEWGTGGSYAYAGTGKLTYSW